MVYPRKIYTAPAEEPVTLTQAQAQCQVEHSEDDALIGDKVTAAREAIENETSRALITQTWDVYPPCFPCGDIALPLGNLQSIGTFEWTDTAGATSSWTVSGSNLLSGSTVMAHIDTVSEPALIRLAYGQVWPTATLKTINPIHIRLTCGYGLAAAVPGPIKAAILLLVRHWYDNRSAVNVGNSMTAVSDEVKRGVDSLLANYRLYAF